MENDIECLDYRNLYEELQRGEVASEVSELTDRHAAGCNACRQWTMQTKDMLSLAVAIPQFDVSEQLTQNILSAVEGERKLRVVAGQYGLLLPVAVICLAGMITVFPIDTLEGVLSTGLSLAGLLLIKTAINGAGTKEMVT
jgi:hypothetical protein